MSIEEGARVAVEQCMNIQGTDRVLIVADNDSKNIGLALRKASLRKTNFVRFFNLDLPAYGGRPLRRMPEELDRALNDVTASFFVAGAKEGELEVIRLPFLRKVVQKARHAHMVGITERVMKEAVAVDYVRVGELTKKMHDILSSARVIKVTTEAGTDLTCELDADERWTAYTGLIREKGHWENLPSGEVNTAPHNIYGRVVVDGSLGDYFGVKYKDRVDLRETPLVIDIEAERWGEMVRAECRDAELLKDFLAYTSQHPHSARVGKLGVGTNVFIKDVAFNMVQDEKMPSVHIALGSQTLPSFKEEYACPTEMSLVMRDCNIWVDGNKVMERGRYLI